MNRWAEQRYMYWSIAQLSRAERYLASSLSYQVLWRAPKRCRLYHLHAEWHEKERFLNWVLISRHWKWWCGYAGNRSICWLSVLLFFRLPCFFLHLLSTINRQLGQWARVSATVRYFSHSLSLSSWQLSDGGKEICRHHNCAPERWRVSQPASQSAVGEKTASSSSSRNWSILWSTHTIHEHDFSSTASYLVRWTTKLNVLAVWTW